MIRKLIIEDYDEVLDLWKNTKGMGISEADSKENIEIFLKRNEGFSFVFEIENRIIGTILSGHDGRRGFIYHLAVDQAYRNKNIGNQLLGYCTDKLKESNIQKCHLFVYNNNELGKKFWRNRGWTMRGDIIIYSKIL